MIKPAGAARLLGRAEAGSRHSRRYSGYSVAAASGSARAARRAASDIGA
jgi:hypothetical protein